MKMVKVSWEIEVDADTPLKAAWQALAIMRDPDSTATVFEVEGQRVDLQSEDAAPSLTTRQREAIQEMAWDAHAMGEDEVRDRFVLITGVQMSAGDAEKVLDLANDPGEFLAVRRSLVAERLLELAEAAVTKQECGPPPPGG